MFLPADGIARVAKMSPLSGVAERDVRDITNGGQIIRGIRRRDARATSLAEIAEIAQISKASMKWASDRRREVPPQIAQIAQIRADRTAINRWWVQRGLLETAKTENTENRLEPGRTHKILRLNPRSIARRLNRSDPNSNPWWIDLRPNTNEPENATENTGKY